MEKDACGSMDNAAIRKPPVKGSVAGLWTPGRKGSYNPTNLQKQRTPPVIDDKADSANKTEYPTDREVISLVIEADEYSSSPTHTLLDYLGHGVHHGPLEIAK